MNLAVFGNPVSHSLSPKIHSFFAKSENIELDYSKIKSSKENLFSSMSEFISDGGIGGNVTVPFKEDVIDFCDKLILRAKNAGAVNTFYLKNGLVYGDNTDGVGLLIDMTVNLKWKIEGKIIVILGAGGAARGILSELIKFSPKKIIIANRTKSKSDSLVEFFGKDYIFSINYDGLAGITPDIVIHTTSLGISNKVPTFPRDFSVKGSKCYDIYYKNGVTPFCEWSKKQGASEVFDGFGMLVEQAAESFYIWTGKRPSTSSLIEGKLL